MNIRTTSRMSAVELLGQQRRVQVADVVLLHDGQRRGPVDVCPVERLGVQPVGFDERHALDLLQFRAVVAPPAAQDDDDPLVVPLRQLLDQPEGQWVVTAHDAVRVVPVLGSHARHPNGDRPLVCQSDV